MGQIVAAGTGLTPRQKKFLAVVLQTPYFLKRFYLTGGTALSYWYLHHRVSNDIDFFSEQEVNVSYINQWLAERQKVIGYSDLTHSQQFGFNTYQLKFPDREILKVDFNYYPSERIERGVTWKGLMIDSLYDIAVNKFYTIATSPRARDYVDLYSILKEDQWTLEQLRKDSVIKFGIHVEILLIARQLLRVKEFTEIPQMLIPVDRHKMEEFFVGLAKSLKPKIFKP